MAATRTGRKTTAAPRWRRIVPWILVVLASVLILVSSLTVWAQRQLLSTDNWANASSELLDDPAIREAVSIYLVNQLYSRVDVTAELGQRLPPKAKPVAAPLAAVLKDASLRATEALLARPAVQTLWEHANRLAHRQFLVIINGGKHLKTSNGEVVLDLGPILDRLAQSSLGAKIVAKLPPDAGRIEIMQSKQLKVAQKGVRAVKWLSVLVGLLALALVAAAVWIAPKRRKMILAVGVSCLICGLLVLVARRFLGHYLIDALTKNELNVRAPALHAWAIATYLLRNIGVNLMIYGIAIFAAGLIAGPSRIARALRRWSAPTLVNRPVIVYVMVACAFLLVVLLGPTDTQRLVPLIVLFGFGFLGVEVLRRQVAREFPDAAQLESAEA